MQSHDKEAAAIAANGAAFARERLTPAGIDSYVDALLRGVAKLNPGSPSLEADDELIFTAGGT